MQTLDPDWARLAAYLAEELDPAARLAVEEWVAREPAVAERLEATRGVLRPVAMDAGDAGDVAVLATAWARLDALRVKRDGKGGRQILRGGGLLGNWTLRGRVPAYATSVITAAVLGILVNVVSNDRHANRNDSPPSRIYVTATGQQATVTLADGSQALLGPATTLSATTHSSDPGIDVRVTGEANFTVAHKEDRPFRVHTENAVVRVLGTTFMVRQYATDRLTRVVVADGRVVLSGTRGTTATKAERVLSVRMLGTVDDSGKVRVTPGIATDDYTGWTRGELVFNQTPVRDAVAELGRAYGVDIRVADSALAAHPLNWSVLITHRSLRDVLDVLGDVLDAHAVRTGAVVTLVPGRSVSPTQTRPSSPSTTLRPERRYGQ